MRQRRSSWLLLNVATKCYLRREPRHIGLRICLGSPFTNRNIYLYALCTYLGWLYDYPAAYAYSIFLAGG